MYTEQDCARKVDKDNAKDGSEMSTTTSSQTEKYTETDKDRQEGG